jgi:hypothetical protein
MRYEALLREWDTLYLSKRFLFDWEVIITLVNWQRYPTKIVEPNTPHRIPFPTIISPQFTMISVHQEVQLLASITLNRNQSNSSASNFPFLTPCDIPSCLISDTDERFVIRMFLNCQSSIKIQAHQFPDFLDCLYLFSDQQFILLITPRRCDESGMADNGISNEWFEGFSVCVFEPFDVSIFSLFDTVASSDCDLSFRFE